MTGITKRFLRDHELTQCLKTIEKSHLKQHCEGSELCLQHVPGTRLVHLLPFLRENSNETFLSISKLHKTLYFGRHYLDR